MAENISENNKVLIIGKVVSEFKESHEVYGEKFYNLDVQVNRLSEQSDIIPLLVSERLINVRENPVGRTVEAIGQYRSYNHHDGERNKLVLSVFVRDIQYRDEFNDYTKTNNVYLDGFICKQAVYRKTPLGREIADVLLAVNRPYGKSDYIPCITWGRNARFINTLPVGERIRVWGRIQSREYVKKFGEDEVVKRTAYEISVNKMERVTEENAEGPADPFSFVHIPESGSTLAASYDPAEDKVITADNTFTPENNEE